MSTGRRSLALSLVNVYETLAISLPTVVDAALHRVEKKVCDDRLREWARKIIEHARIDLEVAGRENMQPGVTYLIMSNHQSHYDVPVLFHVIGSNLRMITKEELFKVPIFGGGMRAAGFISIDRKNRHRAVASLAKAKETLAGGVHIWIAPEGTRSPTGKLLPFKKGGFNLALEADLPVLPVSVRGTRNVLRAKGVRSTPGVHVTVTIHRPIFPERYKHLDFKKGRDQMIADVREILEREGQ
jgi:1-acyl-sn-glycerol-3-phosphate acyltransferase